MYTPFVSDLSLYIDSVGVIYLLTLVVGPEGCRSDPY